MVQNVRLGLKSLESIGRHEDLNVGWRLVLCSRRIKYGWSAMIRVYEMVGECEWKIDMSAREVTRPGGSNVSDVRPTRLDIGYWQTESPSLPREGPIQCRERLGGLLKKRLHQAWMKPVTPNDMF